MLYFFDGVGHAVAFLFLSFVLSFSLSLGDGALTQPCTSPPRARRNAVDFGLPLLNNARTALLFVESLAKKMEEGGLRGYAEGKIPSEVRSWREFVGRRA